MKGQTWFKRDDLFAPLGAGGINGAKLRQCIWLVHRAYEANIPGLVSGASVKSPQLMMTSAVAHHFGMKSHHVIGATKESTMRNHVSVDIAAEYGATFTILNIGFNPNLQREVTRLVNSDISAYQGWLHLEYGISLNHLFHPPEDIEKFHWIGGQQARNIPEEVETLIVPAGSCNSATSVLYGIAMYPPPNLKKVILIGIGPSKLQWMERRLDIIRDISGEDVEHPASKVRKWNWMYCDLHGAGIYSYQDEAEYFLEDITFHPTYEGKCMNYLMARMPEVFNPTTCFWIIGGPVDRNYMKDLATRSVRG